MVPSREPCDEVGIGIGGTGADEEDAWGDGEAVHECMELCDAVLLRVRVLQGREQNGGEQVSSYRAH